MCSYIGQKNLETTGSRQFVYYIPCDTGHFIAYRSRRIALSVEFKSKSKLVHWSGYTFYSMDEVGLGYVSYLNIKDCVGAFLGTKILIGVFNVHSVDRNLSVQMGLSNF